MFTLQNPLPQGRRKRRLHMTPARTICLSFAVIIAIGTLLLTLPVSSRSGSFTNPLDCLFTATSATCVTGLVIFDTYQHWNRFGQLVILAMIQLGGLGFVTFATFFNLAVHRKLGFRSLLNAQESVNSTHGMDIYHIVRMVVIASFSIEAAGALLLSTVFIPQFGLGEGIYTAVFLAVSSFCNAGFDVLGRETPFVSLTEYNGSPMVLLTISALIIIGGLGFTVWGDLLQYRRTRTLMFHTRVVLAVTLSLLAAGTAMFLLCEWNNPATMGPLPVPQKLLAGFFQSVTTRTAGYNSLDFGAMHEITKFFSTILMFIGAAPGSTGGGIKVTTLVVMVMTVASVCRGREETVIRRRVINRNVVYRSLTVMVLGGAAVALSTALIFFTMPSSETVTGINALFESTSAFATVGLSVGVTSVLNIPAKLVMILIMFLGRVGPVSFMLSLALNHESAKNQVYPEGKLLVG